MWLFIMYLYLLIYEIYYNIIEFTKVAEVMRW